MGKAFFKISSEMVKQALKEGLHLPEGVEVEAITVSLDDWNWKRGLILHVEVPSLGDENVSEVIPIITRAEIEGKPPIYSWEWRRV